MSPSPVSPPVDPAKWEEYSAWFKKRCIELRPLWELRIAEAQAEDSAAGEQPRPKAEVAKKIADSSTTDLLRLEAELNSMQVRTSIIVAAATLMFAAFVLKGSANQGVWVAVGTVMLAIALLSTAVSFVLAILSLRPPFKRAWRKPYDMREQWDLLVVSDFTQYVMNSWHANRRTPIITAYKKAHSVAIPLLVVAATLTIPGLAFVILG